MIFIYVTSFLCIDWRRNLCCSISILFFVSLIIVYDTNDFFSPWTLRWDVILLVLCLPLYHYWIVLSSLVRIHKCLSLCFLLNFFSTFNFIFISLTDQTNSSSIRTLRNQSVGVSIFLTFYIIKIFKLWTWGKVSFRFHSVGWFLFFSFTVRFFSHHWKGGSGDD